MDFITRYPGSSKVVVVYMVYTGLLIVASISKCIVRDASAAVKRYSEPMIALRCDVINTSRHLQPPGLRWIAGEK